MEQPFPSISAECEILSSSSRLLTIIGNWKMYKTAEETVSFIRELLPLISEASSAISLAVPFTSIKAAADTAKNTRLRIGAQNMHDASEGAYTGEIAAKMLLEAGAAFVILGHSERRRLFHETNEFINKKIKRALKEKLQPILCIGETRQEREKGQTETVLTKQLEESLKGIELDQAHHLTIAYEPVWAIGTDLAATPEEAQQMHQFCRQWMASHWNSSISEQIVIQYGGSVKLENAQSLIDQPDIDGLLIGGVSLSAQTFSQIANLRKSK